MKQQRATLVGLETFASLVLLLVMAAVLLQPASTHASVPAVLNVRSTPAGVVVPSPSCFTVVTGSCGVTNWTSQSSTGIPITTFTYPPTTTINGTSYSLSPNSLTGCNQGTSGPLPNVCKVSVSLGKTATVSANYVLTPSNVPHSDAACAPNLVQNPGFETVFGSSPYTFWGGWAVWEVGTPPVPHWNRATIPGYWVWVTNGGTPPYNLPPSASEGSKYAILAGHVQGSPSEGVVGELVAPTIVGATYGLSAKVAASGGYPGATSFDIRLRNSATGALSVAVTKASHATWDLISDSFVANAVYDQVVVRYNGPMLPGYEFFGVVDDVHVCRVGATSWWSSAGGMAGLAGVVVAGLFGGLLVRRARRLKISENESARPRDRGFFRRNRIALSIVGVVAAAASIYIGTVAGGVWKKSKSIAASNTRGTPGPASTNVALACGDTSHLSDSQFVTKCESEVTPTPTPTPTQTRTAEAPAVTCVEKETVKAGYKLFRSKKYKYCIQYPAELPVDAAKPDVVTFGKQPSEPGPGWYRVTHAKGNVSDRVKETKARYREPAGSCTESDATIAGEKGKKLDCVGAAAGEHNIYYVFSDEPGTLFELSYVEGSATQNEQYRFMTSSFLCDMFAAKS